MLYTKKHKNFVNLKKIISIRIVSLLLVVQDSVLKNKENKSENENNSWFIIYSLNFM